MVEAEYVKAVDYLDGEFGSVEGAMLLIAGKSLCIRADALSSLSRPLPDPELREKIARLLYDRFIGLRRNAEEAAAEILALVLGVDGSAETGKRPL